MRRSIAKCTNGVGTATWVDKHYQAHSQTGGAVIADSLSKRVDEAALSPCAPVPGGVSFICLQRPEILMFQMLIENALSQRL